MTSSSRETASYRALLDVPNLGRVIVGMIVARTAGAMVSVAIVLFTLTEYGSPALAGIVTFASVIPGLLVSPIAGALLDRHGRTRLVLLDYAVAAGSMWLIGGLGLAHALPPVALVLIAAASSLTGPLSLSGLRSLFPLLVPQYLWERANAIDSNGYVISTLIGPPAAGALVAFLGGAGALVAIGVIFAIASLFLIGMPDPETDTATTGNLLRDAWQGLVYVVRHPTLRALALSISTINLGGGIAQIVIPVLVLHKLSLGPEAVGGVWVFAGVAGMIASLMFGRIDSRNREKPLILWSQVAMAFAPLLLLFVALPDRVHPLLGFVAIGVTLGLVGFFNGPMDIGLFTIRQRRTDPAWMGRAFAVSMSMNFFGFPIGAAAAGVLAEWSIPVTILLAVLTGLAAAGFTWRMLPARATPKEVEMASRVGATQPRVDGLARQTGDES